MSVLKIKNEITGKWESVPFVSGSGSSTGQAGAIIEGDNIEVQKVGNDYKVSADLTNCIKKTDYATEIKAGIIKMWTSTDEEGNIGLNISTEV